MSKYYKSNKKIPGSKLISQLIIPQSIRKIVVLGNLPNKSKKFAVLARANGQTKLIRFGDPNMKIKKNNPDRRKSFRARHKCDTSPPSKLTARYWSCKKW